jgi:hypothetical protein
VFLVLGLYREIWSFWANRWCPWTMKGKKGLTPQTRSH